MSYTIECENDDERQAMERFLQLLRDIGSQSLINVMRDDLTLRFWINGRTGGRVRLSNALPAWRARERV